MARNDEKTASGRVIQSASDKPAVVTSGAGRSREATDFDDLIPGFLEANSWKKIPAQGETLEEQNESVEEDYKALGRAMKLHEVGGSRYKENDPENPHYESHGVWVFVRPKQSRGPAVGTVKDPESGNRFAPGDEGYEEAKARRDAAKANKAAAKASA